MAMDKIRISLQLLAESMDGLEKDVIGKEKANRIAANNPQIDLFGGWASRVAGERHLAQIEERLDSAIVKVRKILNEVDA